MRSACSCLDRRHQWLCLLGQAVLCVLPSWSLGTCPQPSPDSKPTWHIGRSSSSLGKEAQVSSEVGRWAVVYTSKLCVVGNWGTGLWGALGSVFTLWHSHSSLHSFYAHHWWLTFSFPCLSHAEGNAAAWWSGLKEHKRTYVGIQELQLLILFRAPATTRQSRWSNKWSLPSPDMMQLLGWFFFCFLFFLFFLFYLSLFFLPYFWHGRLYWVYMAHMAWLTSLLSYFPSHCLVEEGEW